MMNDFSNAGSIYSSVFTRSRSLSLRFMWQKDVDVTRDLIPRRALIMFLAWFPFVSYYFFKKSARFSPAFYYTLAFTVSRFQKCFKSLLYFRRLCLLLLRCRCSWMDGSLTTFFLGLLPNSSRLNVVIFWAIFCECQGQCSAMMSQSSVLFLFFLQGRYFYPFSSSPPKQGVPADISELFSSSISSRRCLESTILKYSFKVKPTQAKFHKDYCFYQSDGERGGAGDAYGPAVRRVAAACQVITGLEQYYGGGAVSPIKLYEGQKKQQITCHCCLHPLE